MDKCNPMKKHVCPDCGNNNQFYETAYESICRKCGHSISKLGSNRKKLGILYVCNQGRCTNCTWPVCQHTTDIKYAANFVNENGYWKEVVRKDEE